MLYTALFLLHIYTVVTLGQSVGKVYVGQSVNDETELYTFNENYIYDLYVPIYITVEDNGNEVIPTAPINVNVTCELTTSGLNGYSEVTFNTKDVILGNDAIGLVTNVSFFGMVPGRTTKIECWGESSDPGLPSFTKQSSVANSKNFEIRPSGFVSTCSQVVKVPVTASTGSLLVELSESVDIGNTTITCTPITSPNAIDITLTVVTMFYGQIRTQVPYTVSAGGGEPVTVTCTAATIINSPTENIQFYAQNSTGDGSVFTVDTGTVQIVPVLTQLRTTKLTAYLVLDSKVTVDTEFVCRLTVTNDTESAVNIAQNTECLPLSGSSPGVGTTGIPFTTVATTDINMNTTGIEDTTEEAPVVNITDGWNLVDPVLSFVKDTTYYQSVQIYRQGQDVYQQKIRPEVVVVHCCAPDGTNINEKYINQSASFAAVAYLSPNVTTAWDNATDPANIAVETTVLEPYYVEVSPCPCDLTNKSCDVNCCCDDYCTADDIKTFNCIPGIKGGAAYDEVPEYNCTAHFFNKPDWFPLMCVQFENSAFLGYFRNPQPAIRTDADFQTTLNQYDPKYSFEKVPAPDPIEIGSLNIGYKDGLSVKTSLQTDPILSGPNYRLVLPGRSLSGECVFSDPVHFAKEKTESCLWNMKESICSTLSPLNALNYALPSNGPLCRKGLLVLKEQEVETVTITNVDYHCADNGTEYLAPYIRSTDTKKNRLPNNEVKLFADALPKDGEDCYFSNNTGAYICNETNPSTPVQSLPPRCSWDNGFTKVPVPELDNSTEIPVCRNAVVEVRYNFTWKGPQIVLLNASIVLGDIPLLQEQTENVSVTYQDGNDTRTMTMEEVSNFTTVLTQLLNVKWHHEMNESSSSNDSRTSEVYKRSGVIGYESDLPVNSGISVINSTDDTFQYIDTNTSSTLSVWKAGPDSLCETASREPVIFRQNGMGSCLLRLGLEQLQNNCTYLRKLVLNQQDQLMMSNYIGQGGDPDPLNLANWLKIFRQDISYIFGDNETLNSTTMTTEMPVTTTYNSSNVTEPIGTHNYLNDIVGVCSNIPSHINVDILFAEVGKNNDIAIYQILGAKIGYTLSSWSLYCTAADGAKCYSDTQWLEKIANDKDYVQSFIVSSSVNFIEVPGKVPERMSKRSVDRSSDYFICRHDSCWTEAFYPFTRGFRGDDFQYVLSFSLVSLVFLIGLFMISRPWW